MPFSIKRLAESLVTGGTVITVYSLSGHILETVGTSGNFLTTGETVALTVVMAPAISMVRCVYGRMKTGYGPKKLRRAIIDGLCFHAPYPKYFDPESYAQKHYHGTESRFSRFSHEWRTERAAWNTGSEKFTRDDFMEAVRRNLDNSEERDSVRAIWESEICRETFSYSHVDYKSLCRKMAEMASGLNGRGDDFERFRTGLRNEIDLFFSVAGQAYRVMYEVLRERNPYPDSVVSWRYLARESIIFITLLHRYQVEKSYYRKGKGFHEEGEDSGDSSSTEMHQEPSRESVCCAVLGVRAGSDFRTVKTAYKNLMKKHHPDRFHNAPEKEQKRALERSQEISEAFTYLERYHNGR